MTLEKFEEITQQHKTLYQKSCTALGQWRRFIFAIDGRDGVGKSSLARFLAWQLGMPTIETDLMLGEEFVYDESILESLVLKRLDMNRPVIVDGIFLLRTLTAIKLEPDFLIYVENSNEVGTASWQKQFEEYENSFKPKERADFTFLL